MSSLQANFADEDFVRRYLSEGPPAFSPGHAAMPRISWQLLAKRTPCHCMSSQAADFPLRLSRRLEYVRAVPEATLAKAEAMMHANPHMVAATRDEAPPSEAGLRTQEAFYRGMASTGWVAHA